MCKEQKGIRRIVCQYILDEHAIEVQSAILIIMLGIWLLFTDTFQVSPVYNVMASMGNEKGWSVIFISIGVLQLYSLLSNHKWQFKLFSSTINCLWIRKHILLFKGAVWFTLFIGVLFGDPRALSAPIYCVLAVNTFRSFFCIRCKQENLAKNDNL